MILIKPLLPMSFQKPTVFGRFRLPGGTLVWLGIPGGSAELFEAKPGPSGPSGGPGGLQFPGPGRGGTGPAAEAQLHPLVKH